MLKNNCITGFGTFREAVEVIIKLHDKKQDELYKNDPNSPYRQEEQANLYAIFKEIIKEIELAAQTEEEEFAKTREKDTTTFLDKLGVKLQ